MKLSLYSLLLILQKFLHSDHDPDRHQNLITWSLGPSKKLQQNLGLYRICFWEIRPEPDVAGFVKQIRQELVPDFTMILVINKF